MTGNKKYFVAAGILFVFIVGAVLCWYVISSKEQPLPPERGAETMMEKPSPEMPVIPPSRKETVAETVVTGKIDAAGSEPEGVPEGKALPPATMTETAKKESRRIHKPVKSYYDRLFGDMNVLFAYLDQQDYIREYGLPEGTKRQVLTMLADLSAHPPVISGETRDIFILTRNMAHFYRVLGKDNILFIKDIMSHEREIVEQFADLLYEWIFVELRRKNPEVKTSVKDLYEYAGFFLTTLSGKAYLARRLSKTRMIVLYYSILILDMADRDELNRYGIDILPPVNLLMDDMENQRNLDYQRKYLRRLGSIKQRVIRQRESGVAKY
ncbi:MAG: hypothetical protein JW736_02515 [Deltaproteobacteria bacterium]|nr:hypothetical protein [Deltaproteobacteria bacterium]